MHVAHLTDVGPKALEEAGNSTSTPLTACPACSYHTSKTQCHKASKPVLAVVKVSSSRVAMAALSPSILYVDAVPHFPYELPLSLPQQI